jgi:hypothetical protein
MWAQGPSQEGHRRNPMGNGHGTAHRHSIPSFRHSGESLNPFSDFAAPAQGEIIIRRLNYFPGGSFNSIILSMR